MNRIFRQSLAAAVLALVATPVLAQQTEAPAEEVKATHGDWEVVCRVDQKEQCRMRQIGKTADGQPALAMHIGKLKDAKAQDGTVIPAAIRITTPLGTLLREGLRLQIDSGKTQTGIFNICVPSGCIVSEPMTDEFIGQLKAGNAAKISFNLFQEGAVNVNISLKGFTKAYKAL